MCTTKGTEYASIERLLEWGINYGDTIHGTLIIVGNPEGD